MASALQKKNKKWTFRYYQNGIHRRHTCKSLTHEDAKRERISFLNSLNATTNKNDPTDLPIQHLLPEFMQYVTLTKRNPYAYRYALNNLIQTLKAEKIKDLTKSAIDHYRTTRLTKNIKKSTINREIASISHFFTWLIDTKDYTLIHPIKRKLKPFKTKTIVRTRVLTTQEISTIKNSLTVPTIDPKIPPVFYLALYAGLRLKEACNLKKEHILFTENSIIVEPQKTADSDADQKSIPLHKTLKSYLLTQIKKSADPYIVPDYKERHTKCTQLSKKISAHFKALKIKNAGIHTCRHTFISKLANSKVDSADVMQYARISSLKILKIYRHITTKTHLENINKLDY